MDCFDIARAPGGTPDRVRLQCRVRFDADREEQVLWFEVPETSAHELSDSGNAWCVALLPLAATLGEPLRVRAPVDATLLEGCRTVLDIWSAWYPHINPVAMQAEGDVTRASADGPMRRTGLFFSGGVDSFTSLVEANDVADGARGRVTDLLLIHGADIPLEKDAAFARLRDRMSSVARAFDVTLIDIATNIRETRWAVTDYPLVAHGALLAATGLILEPRFDKLIVSSSAPYCELAPYGSHPLTDPLYSTTRTRVRHEGAHLDRPEKLALIANNKVVLDHLHVCWLARDDANCGRCPKCLLTMVGLELAGKLGECTTLPGRDGLEALRHVYFNKRGTYPAYRVASRFMSKATDEGRPDIASLLRHAIRRSDRIRILSEKLVFLGEKRFLPARLVAALTSRLFRSSIRY